MAIKNYYKILEIDSNCDVVSIKKAFRKKIAIYHPDKNKSPEAVLVFDDLIEAFDILSNQEKREAYDKLLNQNIHNATVVFEPIEHNKKEDESDYQEWQKEAKKKSKKYRSTTLEDLLLLDIFLDIGLDSLFLGSDNIVDGIGDALDDVFDLF